MENSENKENAKIIDLHWKHFELHAKQRIQTFYIFLFLMVAIFSGYFKILDENSFPFFKILLMFTSAIVQLVLIHSFHGLDHRNDQMICAARDCLIFDEKSMSESDRLFTQIKAHTSEHRMRRFRNYFDCVFFAFGIIASLVLFASVFAMGCYVQCHF